MKIKIETNIVTEDIYVYCSSHNMFICCFYKYRFENDWNIRVIIGRCKQISKKWKKDFRNLLQSIQLLSGDEGIKNLIEELNNAEICIT